MKHKKKIILSIFLISFVIFISRPYSFDLANVDSRLLSMYEPSTKIEEYIAIGGDIEINIYENQKHSGIIYIPSIHSYKSYYAITEFNEKGLSVEDIAQAERINLNEDTRNYLIDQIIQKGRKDSRVQYTLSKRPIYLIQSLINKNSN